MIMVIVDVIIMIKIMLAEIKKIMIKTISAGQGDRSMGAIAEHDYIEKVIELLIGGDWIVNWKTLKSMKIVSFIETSWNCEKVIELELIGGDSFEKLLGTMAASL